MEYNTQREKIKITDYGRNVYKMIEHAKTLPTKEERTTAAEVIVNVMATVNPSVRSTHDYRQQLWEHLMIMANWQLDVNCPYKLTPKPDVVFKPNPLQHNTEHIRFRHYGRSMESMIRKVAAMEDGEEKELLTALIVAQMKKSYMIWNRTVADNAKIDDYNDVVLKQLEILSGGRLKEGELKLEVNSFLNRPIDMLRSNGNNKKKKRKKNPQQKRS